MGNIIRRPPVDGDVVEERRGGRHATPSPDRSETLQIVEEAGAAFEAAVGGRTVLTTGLALQSEVVDEAVSDQIHKLLLALSAPDAGALPLATIARRAGMQVPTVMRLYKDARISRAHVEAISIVADALPSIVRDIARKAVPYEVTCGACEGIGTTVPRKSRENPNPSPEPCKYCKASGKVIKEPSLETQELALTLGGLLGTKPSVVVNNTSSQTFMAATGPLLQLQKAADSILYSRSERAALSSASSPDPAETP